MLTRSGCDQAFSKPSIMAHSAASATVFVECPCRTQYCFIARSCAAVSRMLICFALGGGAGVSDVVFTIVPSNVEKSSWIIKRTSAIVGRPVTSSGHDYCSTYQAVARVDDSPRGLTQTRRLSSVDQSGPVCTSSETYPARSPARLVQRHPACSPLVFVQSSAWSYLFATTQLYRFPY